MLECQTCNDRLSEFVYGLLDDKEAAEVRAHLAECAACRDALAAVHDEQKLLGQAARAVRVVREFALPGETAPAKQDVPATLPFAPAQTSVRNVRGRRVLGWAIAAAILLALAGPLTWYRVKLGEYERELVDAREEYRQVEHMLEVLPASQLRQHQAAIDKLHAQAAPHLLVVGPTALQAGAKGNLHITTRHPEGNPLPANIRVKLADAATGNIVKVAQLQTDENGQARAEIDAAGAKPGVKLGLTVEADTGFAFSSIQESLGVQTPSFVTRIDTNKNIYQVKDVLFFRILVLDRNTLQPPHEPIMMHVELAMLSPRAAGGKGPGMRGDDAQKTVVRSLEQATGPGGILAAEFAVEEKFTEGTYAISVRRADAGSAQVQPALARVEVVRALPGIRLDPNPYFAGGMVTGELVLGGKPAQLPAQLPGAINGLPVPVTVQPQMQPSVQAIRGGPAPGAVPAPPSPPGSGKVKEKKDAADALQESAKADEGQRQVYRFQAPVPKDLPKGTRSLQLSVQVPSESQKQELRAVAPLTPTDYDIDFYPEGGDLIAGVENRVYFRVRAKNGAPITSDGRLILWMKGKDGSLQIIADEPYELGLGQFEFTPSLKETYTARVTTPNTTAEIAEPFARLGGIRTGGVVLHVAKAVGNQDEPIRMTIRRQGPPRRLLLVAECRGQIVDERWVDVKQGSVDLSLEPAPGARGMIRVTAFEVQGGEATPIAERLVYRAPAQRLDLGFALKTRNFDAGSKASATISARDEAGQPAAAWLLASVVDERFQTRPRSLSAHFLLMNEIQSGGDIDQAEIILNDGPESAAVLERFLGTHGWRRFVAKHAPADGRPIIPAAAAAPIIFSRESLPIAQAQRAYEAKIVAVLAPLQREAIAAKIRLTGQRDQLAEATTIASARLAEFETRAQLGVRLALGGIVGVLLISSIALMGMGGYRLLRGRRSPTGPFAVAFACLVTCLLMLLGGQFLPGPADPANAGLMPIWHAQANVDLEKMLAEQMPKVNHVADGAPGGIRRMAEMPDGAKAMEKGLDAMAAGPEQAMLASAERAIGNLARAPLPAQLDRSGDKNFMERYGMAAAGAKKKEGVAPASAPVTGAAGGGGAGGAGIGAANVAPRRAPVQREFAHVHAPGLLADTLLWHPTLWLANGNGEVQFDVGSGQATYRVLLLGHDPAGRLGFFETRLDVPGAGR